MTQPAARRASSRATPARKASAVPPKTSKIAKAAAKPASKLAAKATPKPNGADEVNGASLGPTSRRSSGSAAAKDQPLKEDIRFLGRLLGDVLREQEGGAVSVRLRISTLPGHDPRISFSQ